MVLASRFSPAIPPMPRFDNIPRAMYEAAGKQVVMTADQEKELARKLRQAKLDLWTALLSDTPTTQASLEFAASSAMRQSKRKHEFDDATFEPFLAAVRRYERRPIEANASQLRRRQQRCVEALVAYDPCMEIALALFHQAKAWQEDQGRDRATTTYTRHLQQIESAWKRHVFFRNRFTERNIRLVMMIAKKFSSFGIPQEDLIQEGWFGLERSVGMFDPERGFKFSTYASWWIRATIIRYCRDHARMVRLPVNLQEKLERYYAASKRLESEGHGFDMDKVYEMTGIPTVKIESMRNMSLEHYYSTDTEIRAGKPLGEVIEDSDEDMRKLNADIDLTPIREVIHELPERQQYIIRARYGLDGCGGRTLQEIATVLGVSRERIRQIEKKAIEDIRNHVERRREKIAEGALARA